MATSSSPLSITASRTLQAVRAAGGGGGGSINLPAANLVIDTFETANMQPTLNNAGFAWSTLNRTSIVTMNPDAMQVWAGSGFGGVSSSPGIGKDWTAKEGSHSLRFRYPPNEPMAEQRFYMTNFYPEIWVRFWVRVPVNYVHGTGNHKFFVLSMGEYSNQSPQNTKVIWEYRPGGTAQASSLDFSYDAYNGAGNSGPIQGTPFMSPADQGRWMQMVLHVKASSSGRSADGVIETWRRFEEEGTFTKFHEKTDTILEMQPSLTQGFNSGFVLGYANPSSFSVETEFLVDTIEFSTESLI
jgi:hypothetical protein